MFARPSGPDVTPAWVRAPGTTAERALSGAGVLLPGAKSTAAARDSTADEIECRPLSNPPARRSLDPTFDAAVAHTPGRERGLWVPSAEARSPSPSREGIGRRRTAAPQREHFAENLAGISVLRSLASYEPIPLAEASGFAARFAADYLSWDEDEPERRVAALRPYLADEQSAVLGWSGTGRQRAEIVTPGRTVRYRAAVIVEVSARVVLYERIPVAAAASASQAGFPEETVPSLAFGPASAPAPDTAGWTAGAGWWVRIAPPVRRHPDGRLVVDLNLDPNEP